MTAALHMIQLDDYHKFSTSCSEVVCKAQFVMLSEAKHLFFSGVNYLSAMCTFKKHSNKIRVTKYQGKPNIDSLSQGYHFEYETTSQIIPSIV
jgi:hypothetical protein